MRHIRGLVQVKCAFELPIANRMVHYTYKIPVFLEIYEDAQLGNSLSCNYYKL